MRDLLRTCAVAVALPAMLLGMPGCTRGPAAETPSLVPPASGAASQAPAPAVAQVSMNPTASLRAHVLTVSAATNLMDGSSVDWQVGTGADDAWRVNRAGKAVVADGRISFRTDVRSLAGNRLHVFLVFTAYGQSEAVRARYGDTGQYLSGDHLEMHGDYRTLEYWVSAGP